MGIRDNPAELASVRVELRRVTGCTRGGPALFAVNYDKLRYRRSDNKYEIDIAAIRNLRIRANAANVIVYNNLLSGRYQRGL